MRDIRGIEIKAGDTLAVPMRQGSSVWLDAKRVISAGPGGVTVQSIDQGNKSHNRPSKLQQSSVLIVQLPDIS